MGFFFINNIYFLTNKQNSTGDIFYCQLSLNINKNFYVRDLFYNFANSSGRSFTGYSVVRSARLLWEQEVAGSNPATPTLKMKRLH